MSALLRSPRLRAALLGLFAAIAVIFGTLFAAYGQADPCRALAVEKARRSKAGPSVEHWTRIETSQMSTSACVSGLLDSWGERLTHYVR